MCSWTNFLTGQVFNSTWNLDGTAGGTAPFAVATAQETDTTGLAVGDFIEIDVTEDARAAIAAGQAPSWILSAHDEAVAQTIDFSSRECGASCAAGVTARTAPQLLLEVLHPVLPDGAVAFDAGPPTATTEQCENGVDDDRDGRRDCADTECTGRLSCMTSESGAACGDTLDNDGDGQADCADSGCSTAVACRAENCTNGADEDADGLVDCADSACLRHSACAVAGGNPWASAPALSAGEVSTLHDQVRGIYEGAGATQLGVGPSVIDTRRESAVMGFLRDRAGAGIPGVEVRILSHPELGSTRTRADGRFDIVVNGGGQLVIDFSRIGYLPSQRSIDVGWGEWASVGDVVLIPLDARATDIDPASRAAIQVARASISTDAAGTRVPTMFVRRGTTGTMRFADGTTRALTAPYRLRMTEYTVGATGPDAMPGTLPDTSAYTYAAELSIDEAVTAGATTVEFSQPLVMYYENFRGIPVGETVPSGYYDRARGVWAASENGRVVQILSVTAGVASVDTDGDGVADTLGGALTTDELRELGRLYPAGTQLWRTPTAHFSAWDHNFGVGPPDDAEFAVASASDGDPQTRQRCEAAGSVVSCLDRTLGERLSVAGTPHTLEYWSGRVVGDSRDYVIRVPVIGEEIPRSLHEIQLRFTVAGQTSVVRLPRASVTPNLVHEWTWNGLDAAGRRLRGGQRVRVDVGYTYQAVYGYPARFGAVARRISTATGASSGGGGGGPVLVGYRQPIVTFVTLWSNTTTFAGSFDREPGGYGIGGWDLSVHHALDVHRGEVLYGNGTTRQVRASLFDRRVSPVLGECDQIGGGSREFGDDAPAVDAFTYTGNGGFAAVGPDGTLYFTDGPRIRYVDPRGIVRTLATTGVTSPTIMDIGVEGENSLIALATVGGRRGLYRIGSDRVWRLVAGGVASGPYEGPAASAQLNGYTRVAVAPDGSVYLGGVNLSVLRPDGTVELVARTSTASRGDARFVSDTTIGTVRALAVDRHGNVHFVETVGSMLRVRRIRADGRLETIAGSTSSMLSPIDGADGVVATDGVLSAGMYPEFIALAVTRSGDPVFATSVSGNTRVRTVGSDGLLYIVGGTGPTATGGRFGDGSMARATRMGPSIRSLALAPNGDIYVYADSCIGRLESDRVDPFATAPDATVVRVPSEDGLSYYSFDLTGRHLGTYDAVTNRALYTFEYDSSGRLSAAVDSAGRRTQILRPTSTTMEIVSPDGVRTNITLNAAGYIERIVDAAGGSSTFDYHAQPGLLWHYTDANARLHTFEYDARGGLLRDVGPGGITLHRSQALTPTETADGWSVQRTTAGGQVTQYHLAQDETVETRAVVAANGLTYVSAIGGDGRVEVVQPDGSAIRAWLGPDARFGMDSPIAERTQRVLSSGRTACSVSERIVERDAADSMLARRVETRVRTWERDPRGAACGPDMPCNSDEECVASVCLPLCSETAPTAARLWTIVRDRDARTLTTTSPEGRVSVVTLDASDRVSRVSMPGVQPMEVTYVDGRLAQATQTGTTDHPTRTTILGYSTRGFVADFTDGAGVTAHFERDAVGRPQTTTVGWDRTTGAPLAGAAVIGTERDAMGNLTGVTPPGRGEHVHVPGLYDDLVRYAPPDGLAGGRGVRSETAFVLDRDGRPESVTRTERRDLNGDGTFGASEGLVTRSVGFQYFGATAAAGSRHQLSSIVLGRGTQSFTYGASGDWEAGRLRSATDPSGTTVTLSWNGGLLEREAWSGIVSGSVQRTFGGPELAVSRLRVTMGTTSRDIDYGYDDDGLLTSAGGMTITPNATTGLLESTSIGRVTTSVTPNPFGEAASEACRWTTTAGVAGELTFAYARRDGVGRLIERRETTQGLATASRTLEYTYDREGRLTHVRRGGAVVEQYGYDANGNRVSYTNSSGSGTATYDGRDRLLTYGGASFTYDAWDRMATRVDASGTTTYTYDDLGNLMSVARPAASTISYRVDAMGRRVARYDGTTQTHRWIYLGQLEPVAEIDASGTVSYFVYGTRAHVPDLMIRSGVTYRYVVDQVGSVRALVNTSTGAVAQELDYDSFGRVLRDTAPGFQPFGFAGGQWDSATGLVRFGLRDFSAELGRWTAVDPVGFLGRQANLMVYVGNDPVSLVDPSGEFVVEALMFSAFVAGAAAIGYATGFTGDVVQQAVYNGPSGRGIDIEHAHRVGQVGAGVGAAIAGAVLFLEMIVAGEVLTWTYVGVQLAKNAGQGMVAAVFGGGGLGIMEHRYDEEQGTLPAECRW